jgi:hypothetical protein
MAAKVEIVGLADLLRDLKRMPDDVQKVFASEMKDVAEIVARAAAVKVPSKSGNAISSIVSRGTTSGASVAEGGSSAPYMQWLDFGSRTPRSGNTRTEGPWRGSGKGPTGGRFLYPAIEEKNAEIMDAAGKAVDKAAERAGFH